MEVEAKKRKKDIDDVQTGEIVKTQESNELLPAELKNTAISDLNDDCIEAICRWLPVNDLCSFSLTCRRVSRLANSYFHRYNTNYDIEISNDVKGPVIKTKDRYAYCFRRNIRRIRLSTFWDFKSNIPLFTFVRMYFCENLIELELDSINLKSKEPYGRHIKTQLKNLQTISFINCSKNDIYEGILQYCENLKHLIVKEEVSNETNCSWLRQEYPKLETLIFYGLEERNGLNINPLTHFFQLNSHIKQVACTFKNIISILSHQQNISLEYLVLRIEHVEFFSANFNQLLTICKQQRVKRIKLEFGWHVKLTQEITRNLNRLNKLQVLHGLSFSNKQLQTDIHHPIAHCRFETIKSLSLEVAQPISDLMFKVLSVTVPNLEEIHLHPWWKDFTEKFRKTIGIFAQRFTKLRKVVVYRADTSVISVGTFVHMDYWRRQLPNACHLTVYLPQEIIEEIQFIVPVDSLVDVKPISALERDIFTSDFGRTV